MSTIKTSVTEVKILMEEHLENSSPLIIEEIGRWRDLLWDDYLDYKYRKNHP